MALSYTTLKDWILQQRWKVSKVQNEPSLYEKQISVLKKLKPVFSKYT
jgi:hypothetical protein